jgi:hypothetical protein
MFRAVYNNNNRDIIIVIIHRLPYQLYSIVCWSDVLMLLLCDYQHTIRYDDYSSSRGGLNNAKSSCSAQYAVYYISSLALIEFTLSLVLLLYFITYGIRLRVHIQSSGYGFIAQQSIAKGLSDKNKTAAQFRIPEPNRCFFCISPPLPFFS